MAHHCHDWARGDVVHQVLEERLGTEVLVVLFCKLHDRQEQLQGTQSEAFSLKSADNLANKPPLHAVWLHLSPLRKASLRHSNI